MVCVIAAAGVGDCAGNGDVGPGKRFLAKETIRKLNRYSKFLRV